MRKVLLTAALACAPLSALSAELFSADIVVGANSAHVAFNRAEDVVDLAKSQNLSNQGVNYTGVEQASLTINFRGLTFVFAYPAHALSNGVASLLGVLDSCW